MVNGTFAPKPSQREKSFKSRILKALDSAGNTDRPAHVPRHAKYTGQKVRSLPRNEVSVHSVDTFSSEDTTVPLRERDSVSN